MDPGDLPVITEAYNPGVIHPFHSSRKNFTGLGHVQVSLQQKVETEKISYGNCLLPFALIIPPRWKTKQKRWKDDYFRAVWELLVTSEQRINDDGKVSISEHHRVQTLTNISPNHKVVCPSVTGAIQIHSLKARRLKLCMWPLLIMRSVIGGTRPASVASEAIEVEVLLKVWTFCMVRGATQASFPRRPHSSCRRQRFAIIILYFNKYHAHYHSCNVCRAEYKYSGHPTMLTSFWDWSSRMITTGPH